MAKPAFNPDAPFEVAGKPPFDPSQPFQESSGTKPGLLSRIKTSAQTALSVPGATSSPIISLPSQAQNVINTGFNKMGEKVATDLSSRGIQMAPGTGAKPLRISPVVAAGLGTLTAMTPDIISMAGTPVEAVSIAPKTAEGFASRALGNTKKFLATPFSRGKAQEAGKVALEEGVIPALGSAEEMMKRAQGLKLKTGRLLGHMRSAVGPQDISPVLTKLDNLGESLTGFSPADIPEAGLGGTQGQTIKQIQFAKDTLNNLLIKGKKVDLNDVIKAKTSIGKTINWLADNATQGTHKSIVKAIENSVKDILGGQGADLGKYNYLKKTYGASASMIKSLNNELSRGGNMPINLPNQLIAGGELIMGNPVQAAATAGLLEAARRRGAGIAASSLYKARIPIGASMLLRKREKK